MGRSKMSRLTEDARKMLEGKNFVYLATVNPDGTPQVTPTWVDTDGHFVLINTAVGRVKHRNMKKNPHVALAITDQTNPYNLIVIKGKVVDHVTGKVAEDHIDKMAKKYQGLEKYPHRKPGEQRVLVKIDPVRIVTR
jgi:PPOX class probable F420-dependent enzyme